MSADSATLTAVTDLVSSALPIVALFSLPVFLMVGWWALKELFWGFGGGYYGDGGGGGGGWEPPGPPPIGPEDHGLDQDAILREAEEVIRQAEREIQGMEADR